MFSSQGYTDPRRTWAQPGLSSVGRVHPRAAREARRRAGHRAPPYGGEAGAVKGALAALGEDQRGEQKH